MPTIDELEQRYRALLDREDRDPDPSDRLVAEVERAADAYYDAKNDHRMCQQFGCRVDSGYDAYCEEHRD